MTQRLPYDDFKWVSESELGNILSKIPTDDTRDESIGYTLEVDMEYPQELHQSHNDFPLAPEQMFITSSMLSPYSKEALEALELKTGKVQKLVAHLGPRNNYIVHHRVLRLYISLGMQVTKVHRAISYKEKRWMSPYIDHNTKRRQEATNACDKDLYKAKNNSVS